MKYHEISARIKFIGKLTFIGLILASCAPASPNQPANPTPAGINGETPAIVTQVPDATEVEPGPNCYGEEIHPVGQSISDVYDHTYEEVMTWFCSGYTFEDILLAAESSEQTEIPIEELFAMLDSGMTWDEIWIKIGILEE